MTAADDDHFKTGREIHHAPRACLIQVIRELGFGFGPGCLSSQVGKYRDFAPPKEPFGQNLTSCGELAVKKIKKKEIYK
ncbi:hypothetical protein, partial [Pseudomonas sp. Q12-87]|uniref:hypothetical protein n=1 Tax=Pseudomonas sp. Q12-87 TaxID=177989 RepID=UPI001C44AF88